MASLHIRRKSSKREARSFEDEYLKRTAFIDFTLEYLMFLLKYPSTYKLTRMKDGVSGSCPVKDSVAGTMLISGFAKPRLYSEPIFHKARVRESTQSSFFTTVPRILAFPPKLSTSFLPHALQPTFFVEAEKTTRSSPQSGHFTWRKLLLGLGMGSLLLFTRLSPPFSALFPFS